MSLLGKDLSPQFDILLSSCRFGHSMVQGIFQMFDMLGHNMVGSFPLHKAFFDMEKYDEDYGLGMEKILSGLVNQVIQYQVK